MINQNSITKMRQFSLQDHDDIPFYQGERENAFWKLISGDSRKILPLLPSSSINCVVTSPPYFWQRDYNVDGQIGLEYSVQEYVDNIVDVFQGLKHVLVEDGTIFLNLGDTYYSAKGEPRGPEPKHRGRRMNRLRAVDTSGLGLPRKTLIGIPWRVALALMNKGWVLRSSVIWRRNTFMPEPSAKDRPWRTYEFVFIFAKNPRYYFNRKALNSKEEDVWIIEPDRNNYSRGTHLAPYPRALVEKCIDCGCPEGGVVLDPFVGGGTTMSVAMEMGRSAVGIELNPVFCDVIVNQLNNLV